MKVGQNITHITREQIDQKKWDDCIYQSSLPLLYAETIYLDQMASNWDALVLNDYEAVMPLPWKRKYRVHYLYQPFLTAQLGIFGKHLSPNIIESFIAAIPKKFWLVEINLNSKNTLNDYKGDLRLRSNYTLLLDEPYESIYDRYRENIRRNIKKSQQLGCITEKNFPVDHVINLAVEQMRQYNKESAENVNRFRKLYQALHAQGSAITYGIFSSTKELLSSAVFFIRNKRAYYILVGNHPNGRTLGASHALIDAFIKDHAGSGIVLDFEGSDIRNLAFFYSSFGAKEEKYPALKINRLPWYIKWMK